MAFTTFEVMERLARKYSTYDWIYLQELRRYNGYHHKRMRIVDAIAINLYPSHGCEISGFEVKTDRGDWLGEMKDSDKAHEFKQFCHRWWLVIGDRDVIKLEELPQDWGLIWPRGDNLIIKKGAPKLEPRDLDMELYTSILKRVKKEAQETQKAKELQADLDEAYKLGYNVCRDENKKKIFRLEKEIDDLGKVNEKFFAAAGSTLRSYNVDEMGRLVRFAKAMLNKGSYHKEVNLFSSVVDSLSKDVKFCKQILEKFQKDFQEEQEMNSTV